MSLRDEVLRMFQQQESPYCIFGADSNASNAINEAFEKISRCERVNALLLFNPRIDMQSTKTQKQLQALKARNVKIEVCVDDDGLLAFWQQQGALVWVLNTQKLCYNDNFKGII